MISLQFRGWGREVYPHNHKVQPVKHEHGKYWPLKNNRPLTWKTLTKEDGMWAFGKVDDLSLSGTFLVRFELNKAEIKNILRSYIESDPVTSLQILSEIQIEVIKSLQESQNK